MNGMATEASRLGTHTAEPGLQGTLERLYGSLANSTQGLKAIEVAFEGPGPQAGNGQPGPPPPMGIEQTLRACLGKADEIGKQVEALHRRVN